MPRKNRQPHTTTEAFLQDIVEHSEDDAPRLIFADWLDDHDEAIRAEFIRLQVELARMRFDDPKRAEHDRRIAALLSGARDELFPFPATGPDAVQAEFRRGFPDRIWTTAAHF